MFRATTATTMLAAIAVKSTKDTNESNSSLVCKPSELPIYAPLNPSKQKVEHVTKDSVFRENLEGGIRVVRTGVQDGYNAVAKRAEVLTDYIDTAKSHTRTTIDYLNEPQNTLPRTGAIAMGGLAGFIFATRGGFLKKIIYTSLGAGTVASLCYPRQAEEQARVALYEGRKAFAVAYNFVKGVKPGSDVSVEPLNKFPTSLQDLKFLVLDLFDEAKDALFSKKK